MSNGISCRSISLEKNMLKFKNHLILDSLLSSLRRVERNIFILKTVCVILIKL